MAYFRARLHYVLQTDVTNAKEKNKMLTKAPKKQLASWPPELHIKAHKVQDGDNWWSLAEKYGRKDPWDIIQYNFETKNPEEVNYYLEKLIGCHKSNDGKNYSFSSSDSPGIVYIPPAPWYPSHGPYQKVDWRQILQEGAACLLPELPVDYARLSGIIESKLKIVADPKLSTPYEYDYGNTLYVRPERVSGNYDWMYRELYHIDNGPLGRGRPYSDEAEAWAWICARAEWDMFPTKLPFPLNAARSGHKEKRDILEAARVFLSMRNTFAEKQRFRELTALVRRDPDYTRRIATSRRRVA